MATTFSTLAFTTVLAVVFPPLLLYTKDDIA